MEARNAAEIEAGYTCLARALGVAIDNLALRDAIDRVHAALLQQQDNGRLLIIYDDAKSEHGFFETMVSGLPTGCDVLITSRSPNWKRVEV